ncbi:response regulator [Chroococcidiopsis sp. CCMEE 29]|jgi:twitching motility two-component system response regulator PilG|uniref:response regulator n=1 Tax=Chroococcidiopsis sp. CCMEE 29 TaxID=155894 RepID=UPI00201FE6A3|nr:response regulator [Chroococcidiopsis sp. CCMEE 29]
MQGNLNEIDICSILQLIELGQRTGELFVEAYSSYNHSITGNADGKSFALRNSKSLKQSWFIFFLNGQIVYVIDSDSSLSRLRDYLCHYQLETSLDRIVISSLVADNAPEYGYLWALLEHHILTPAQGRSIIQGIVHETLFDLLSLHQGFFIFDRGPTLAPQLTTFEISSLVRKIMKQVQEWKQLHPHIQSPSQCLAIADFIQLRQALPEATANNLEHWADGKTSLRQLARYLNRDILTVAKAIYPFVKHGWIQLHYPAMSATTKPKGLQLAPEAKIPYIVCIDDGSVICKAVESTLKLHGYEAIGCNNPLEALSLVFQFKPDLILCDIVMPELDGYELCAMLRRSSIFRQTPIIMLTAKDLFIDRVKARMVGATDYLTKPFADSELLMLIEKHLHLDNNFSRQQCGVIAD